MAAESYSLIITIVSSVVYAFILGFCFYRLKLPIILGYLLAGVLVGPYTPGFVGDISIAKQLAEIGVILLMFDVGMHFSLQDLIKAKAVAFFGAIIQIFLTSLIGFVVFYYFSFSKIESFIMAISLSIASTVVLIRNFQQQNLINTNVGKTAIGWLVVEDILMVLILVLLPATLNSFNNNFDWQSFSVLISKTLIKIFIFIAFMIFIGKYLPNLLKAIHNTNTSELMTLGILAIACGFAFIAYNLFDTSFALGAFMAGFVLNESDIGKKMSNLALPLRDLFAVLFFIATGMVFNPAILIHETKLVLITFLLIVLIRPMIIFVLMRMLKQSKSDSLNMSFGLAQIGEFSFILGALALKIGNFSSVLYDLIIAGSILSIAVNFLLFKIKIIT